MKASDSVNSLTGLTDHVDIQIEETSCFICLEELNENKEPLVDSSLLRTCGCRFKVHPACWNEWMKGKSDYDCPICRKKSLGSEKNPTPIQPVSDWTNEEQACMKMPIKVFILSILVIGAVVMVYEMVTN